MGAQSAPEGRVMIAPQPSTITVLHSVNKLLMTKEIRLHRKTGKIIKSAYGNEKHFRVTQVDLNGFNHLCKCLDTLTQRPFAFVIRGEPLPGTNLDKTRRLVHHDPQTGDPATFAETERSWFAVDLDKVKRPIAIDPVSDPDGAIEHLIGLLPPELHDASCWWQFTCSQSLPGCEDTLSARLWFWLLEPISDAALTRWADCANKVGKLIDRSIYRAVQPHYIASPIFEDGIRDPLPRRYGVRIGLDNAVSLLIPEPSAEDPYVGGEGYVGIGIAGHLAEIGGERGFRAPMVSAIAAYFTANGADANPEPIKARIREAIERADPGGRTAAEIDRYCSDRHLNDIVGWVRARERAKPPPAARLSLDDFLTSLASAGPVDRERVTAVTVIARHLLRQRYLNPRLAKSLVVAWSDVHCAPPLPHEQIDAIVNSVAARQVEKETARHG
jgi:hypothetical protein